ncbi:hypothetical protein COT97_03955 [Candidatus Falkowbacteria bacterium CG10_big_fil_rev_8_21_14_0_10_39_11]|uniref:Uncharacterized protein n=1 Tax=Candidatus Falkowbacteria bacterium CG10_big_fil_rev_8_21_14_0_10_39_11 TaxID=1974565 RepID=A0A2H0V4H3_9BACT|nr:MAG: hypothetical protein COT97_03955 [Candidatus Falkowbacteria bacterium CG10_big_fil_rev_8_21_14_0_10_39_11]
MKRLITAMIILVLFIPSVTLASHCFHFSVLKHEYLPFGAETIPVLEVYKVFVSITIGSEEHSVFNESECLECLDCKQYFPAITAVKDAPEPLLYDYNLGLFSFKSWYTLKSANYVPRSALGAAN